MSFDSDFFIYDLHNGYIPINYFDPDLLERDDGSCFMHARIYKLDNFIDYFNSRLQHSNSDIRLRKELLPVFAILNGNDYVESIDMFGSFLLTIQASNNNLLMRNSKQRGIRFARIFEWLTQFSTLDQCIDVLVKVCKAELGDKIRKIVEESVEEYMLQKKCSLLEHLDIIR